MISGLSCLQKTQYYLLFVLSVVLSSKMLSHLTAVISCFLIIVCPVKLVAFLNNKGLVYRGKKGLMGQTDID